MHKNFAMTVLQTVSRTRAEACPAPCVNTTNKLQPFGHRRGKKTSGYRHELADDGTILGDDCRAATEDAHRIASGGGEIRTRGRLATSPVFKTGAIGRSATPP